ncbi:MAG: hypothetical protein LBL13_10230 [Bacteroidales bacterium]|jgi:conjugative transposon TraJ protein|nr:hypothetical protein [Bacteroidales bacterium]
MFNLDFEKTFQDIFDKLSVRIADIGSIVAGIIGIGALFYFAWKTWGALARNESIDLYPLLKPLVIVFLCLNFYTVVITPVHYILAPLRSYTITLRDNVVQEHAALYRQIQDKAKADKERLQREQKEKLRAANSRSWSGRVNNFLEEYVSDPVNEILYCVSDEAILSYLGFDGFTLAGAVMEILISVLSLAKDVVWFVINCLRLFFLIILGMIGPIAFTLSLFPSFEGSLSNWFAKYISIYLWAPVCNIIGVVLSQIECLMMDNLSFSQDNAWSIGTVLIIFYVIGIASYLSVPTIATWAVQGGASAMELSSTLQGARKAALIAGGAGAAASGRMSGSIKEGVKNIVSKFKK